MTKAAMNRLEKSDFFHEACENVKAWDYYLHVGDTVRADECMHNWLVAKSALEFITGNLYGISRNGETVSIVNERDDNDRLFTTAVHR